MNFFSKIFLKIVARWSCDTRASITSLSPRNFGEFTMQNFCDTHTNVMRVSYDGHATVLRKHPNTSQLFGEKKIKTELTTHLKFNFWTISHTHFQYHIHSSTHDQIFCNENMQTDSKNVYARLKCFKYT